MTSKRTPPYPGIPRGKGSEDVTNFAWTPGAGEYKHYPPYVNLTGNRLTVRGLEKLDGSHPMPGDSVSVELPPEAIAELAAALNTRVEGNRNG